MSKLIAKFPNQPPNVEIHISTAGVELYVGSTDEDRRAMTLDPVSARTLGTLLNHASHEAEMMRMRAAMEHEHEETQKEVDSIVSIVRPPKP